MCRCAGIEIPAAPGGWIRGSIPTRAACRDFAGKQKRSAAARGAAVITPAAGRLRDTAVLHGCRRAAVSGAFAPAKENLVFEPLTSRLRTLRSPARYGFCPPEHSKNPCIFNRFRAFCKFGENTFGGIPYSAFTRSHPSPRSALHACNLPKDCDSTALRVFAIQSTIPSLQMR